MNCHIKKIPIEQIDFLDDTFRISFNRDYSKLRTSIEEMNIINTPIIREINEDRYIIVSGYGRLKILKELEMEAYCRVIDGDDIDETTLFLTNFYENVTERGFNLIEQSIALNKLRKYFTDDVVLAEALPLFGYHPSKTLFDRIISYIQLPEKGQLMIVEETLNPAIVPKLLIFTPDEINTILEIFEHTKMTFSMEKEFVEGVYEISKRTDKSIKEILENAEIKETIQNEKLQPYEKCTIIRNFIKKNLFPQFTHAEEQYNHIIKESGIMGKCKITPPPYFEGKTFKFGFTADSPTELQQKLLSLQNKIDKIKEIFEI